MMKMPDFSCNLDRCLFSKRDTSLFLEEGAELSVLDKTKVIQDLAPKHKISALEFNASKALELEDIIQAMYFELESLIGFDVQASLVKYSDEKKIFVLAELLKDTAVIVHNAKQVDQELMVKLQRLSLTLKRYTRVRLRLIFIDDQELFEHGVDAGMRLEYVKLYFSQITDKTIAEMKQSIAVEIKLERRGIERFLGSYIETVKLRPRVKSFLGHQ
ncbi:MAG: hypothetical protein ACRBEE_02365 [Arenicella sp.]